MECQPVEQPLPQDEIVGSSNLQIVKKYYKEALKFVNEGLNLEDKNKTKEAAICYKKGLRSLEGALKLPNGYKGLTENEAKEYKSILSKLTRAQTQVYLRLEEIEPESIPNYKKQSAEPSAPPLCPSEQPLTPPLTDLTDSQQPNVNKEANDIRPKHENGTINGQDTDTWQDVKELINIEEGVRLFHVDGKGEVSTWTSPCKLNIFQILKENIERHAPAAFMKCGEWIYPMEPGKSPVLQTQQRTYMFPDISIQEPAITDTQIPCVGVVLSDMVPDTLVKRFERILSCYCDFRKDIENRMKEKPKRPPPPKTSVGKEVSTAKMEEIIATPAIPEMTSVAVPDRSWSDKISSGINTGSQWVSWGLVKGAQYTSVLVEKGAATLREKIKPNEQHTSVDPQISHNIRQLHIATGSVVQVSAFLVTALGELTVNLGKKLAPHVLHHGQQALPDKYKLENNDKNQKTFQDAKKVAAAGIKGFGIMFLALEQAGKDLYNSVTSATVQTVSHKYGNEVGETTGDAMGAAGNTVMAYWNIQRLGPKAIAKRAVKDTGKAMVLPKDDEDHENKKLDER